MDILSEFKNLVLSFIRNASFKSEGSILLLDDTAMSTISLVLSQSEAIKEKVFLIKPLSAGTPLIDSLPFLATMVFCRPNPENIDQIVQVLENGNLSEVHLAFSKQPNPESVLKLAEADQKEKIVEVKHLPLNFSPLDSMCFTPSLSVSAKNSDKKFKEFDSKSVSPILESRSQSNVDFRSTAIESILSVLNVLKVRPLVRYSKFSSEAEDLSNEIERSLEFKAEKEKNGILLVLDRKMDPFTPLLMQWTYEAMVHEIIGISSQVVTIGEEEKISLSDKEDSFFKNCKFNLFSKCAQEAEARLEALKKKKKQFQTKSLSDLQLHKVSNELPKISEESDKISKHMAMLTKISRAVQSRNLMEVSEVEQEISSGANTKPQYILNKIKQMTDSGMYAEEDIKRLSILFFIRFKNLTEQTVRLKTLLKENNFIDSLESIKSFKEYLSTIKNPPIDLFNQSLLKKSFSTIQQAIKGVENVYTRHEPILKKILLSVMAGKLSDERFPSVSTTSTVKENLNFNFNFNVGKQVFVYFIGGFTHEEKRLIRDLNESGKMSFIIGGDFVLNSKIFINGVK